MSPTSTLGATLGPTLGPKFLFDLTSEADTVTCDLEALLYWPFFILFKGVTQTFFSKK